MMFKGTQRRLAVTVVALTALSPTALLVRPASAFPHGDPVSTFNDRFVVRTRIAKLKQTISQAGTFKGSIDRKTGQLKGAIALPPATFADKAAGLMTATAAIVPTKPVTGHMNRSNSHVTAKSTFVLHIVTASTSAASHAAHVAHVSSSNRPAAVPITLPTLPVTLPTLPVTIPTLPVTIPTAPVTLPTLPRHPPDRPRHAPANQYGRQLVRHDPDHDDAHRHRAGRVTLEVDREVHDPRLHDVRVAHRAAQQPARRARQHLRRDRGTGPANSAYAAYRSVHAPDLAGHTAFASGHAPDASVHTPAARTPGGQPLSSDSARYCEPDPRILDSRSAKRAVLRVSTARPEVRGRH